MPRYYDTLLAETEKASATYPDQTVVLDAVTFRVVVASSNLEEVALRVKEMEPDAVPLLISPKSKTETSFFHFCPK